MKNFILMVFIFIIGIGNVNASTCSSYNDRSEREYNKWLDARYDNPSKDSYYNNYKKYREKYNDCYNDYKKAFDNGNSSFDNGDYLSAIKYYKQAGYLYGMDGSVKKNLGLSYFKLAYGYFDKKEFNNAIKYYKEAEKIGFSDKFSIYVNIGVSYYKLKDTKNALIYYKKARSITFKSEEIKEIDKRIQLVENYIKEEKEKKNAVSNDTYSYKQYYIKKLHIRKAQKSFSKSKQVIIAVIDDGININHPDLSNNIWVNKNEIPGNGKDDDNNGYVDDYSGVNFVKNDFGFISNIIPAGTHGTEVAGIIGASINNNEGIMGIAKNVKIMNLRAFPLNGKGAKDKDVLKAINYAIDNGANIINLSLGSSNNLLTINNPEYNKIFEKAYNKGIIIVIAAGNGDVLSKQTEGVNTKVNPVYPVCSENYYKHIIGVGAQDEEGYRARWSNYESCVDFYTPGVNIMTTYLDENSKTAYTYNSVTGTSFSAPIVSGIIGLGYNKYGKMSSSDIYDSLYNSLEKNSVGNYEINVEKYLKELGKIETIKIEKIKKEEELNKKIKIVLNYFNKKTLGFNELKKKNYYKKYIKLLNNYINKISDINKKKFIEGVIEGMNLEIK